MLRARGGERSCYLVVGVLSCKRHRRLGVGKSALPTVYGLAINHNANYARYQIIAAGGTESVSLGSHMLDTYIHICCTWKLPVR